MTEPTPVTLPEEAWEAALDSDPCRLTAAVLLNGTRMRLTAIEVAIDAAGTQVAVDPEDDEDFADIHRAFAAEGPYSTLTIRGRSCVVFADPHP